MAKLDTEQAIELREFAREYLVEDETIRRSALISNLRAISNERPNISVGKVQWWIMMYKRKKTELPGWLDRLNGSEELIDEIYKEMQ